MRIPRYLQDKNPSQQEIERQYDRIETTIRHIQELERELAQYEQLLADTELSQYVVADKNESFWDHISNVEYVFGYYQSIDEASQVGAKEYPNGFVIYNLVGEKVA